MSTFPGTFKEFPFVSADRFDGKNIESKVFFLSHCHMDHMMGLNNSAGLPGPLFTSAVSKVLVTKQFPNIKEIRVLDIEGPEEICYESDGIEYRIVVTALPARHCPGSVMFLIQSQEHKVLYTGDFRLTKQDLESNFPSLYCIEPDVVYLDSTFLNQKYMHFPIQSDSINVICDLISEWTSKSQQHKVVIRIPAQYGSEFLFTEIGRKLKLTIYIAPHQLDKYIFFPDMDHCISNDLDKCQIWLQQAHEKSKCTSSMFRLIQPSAIYWKHWQPSKTICKETRKNVFRVCYSSHSSFSEIKDFLEFVKPKKVEFNVVTMEDGNNLHKYVNEILYSVDDKNKTTANVTTCRFDKIYQLPCGGRDESPERSHKMPMKRIKL